MNHQLLRTAVRTRFRTTGREHASGRIRKAMENYLALAESAGPDAGARHA